MATALVGLQRGYQVYAKMIDEAQGEVDRYQAEIDQCVAKFNESDQAQWQQIIAGKLIPQSHNLALWSAAIAWRYMSEAERKLNRIKREAPAPGTPDKIRIEVVDSFDIKDTLKARGYTFERDTHYTSKPAWVMVTAEQDAAKAEVAWFTAQGIKVERQH